MWSGLLLVRLRGFQTPVTQTGGMPSIGLMRRRGGASCNDEVDGPTPFNKPCSQTASWCRSNLSLTSILTQVLSCPSLCRLMVLLTKYGLHIAGCLLQLLLATRNDRTPVNEAVMVSQTTPGILLDFNNALLAICCCCSCCWILARTGSDGGSCTDRKTKTRLAG